MNIFRLHTGKQTNETACIWLVVADNLLEAISLIPSGLYVKAAEVERTPVAGPPQLIASIRQSTLH